MNIHTTWRKSGGNSRNEVESPLSVELGGDGASLNVQITNENLTMFAKENLGSGAYGKIVKGTMLMGTNLTPGQGNETTIAAFDRECRFLKSFQHPNIVQHLSTERHPSGGMILVTELMDCSLKSYLSGLGGESLTSHCQLSLSKDLASALAYIHSRQVIHRDLCGDRILLHPNQPVPTAKISDFGMSRLLDPSQMSHTLTAVSHRMRYLLPEALRQEDEKYDDSLYVFSLGVIVVQIIRKVKTGKTAKDRSVLCSQIPITHKLKTVFSNSLHRDMRSRPTAKEVSQVKDQRRSLLAEAANWRNHDVMKFLVEECNADVNDSKDSEEEDKIPDLPKYCFCHGRKWLILDFLRRVAELTDRFEISDNIMLGINNEEVMFYLWYLDCIGTLMYYTKIPDDEDVIDCFKNHVICFPQVIFDSASQRIVCSMSTLHAEGSVTKREQKGQFSLESIEILCKIEQVIDGLEKKELISVEQVIKLLKHVNLLCPIIHKEAVGEQITYLMPTVLDCATLDELTTPSSPDTNNPELLLITFKCGYIPTGVFADLLKQMFQRCCPGDDETQRVQDNLLHVAHKHDDVDYVLTNTHTNPNTKNDYQQSPLSIAESKGVIKQLIQHRANVEELYTQHRKILSNVFSKDSLKSPVKIFVIGHGGAGKSTMIGAMKYEPTVWASLVNSLISPREVDNVDQRTAGIVPQVFKSRLHGDVFYNFAVQKHAFFELITIIPMDCRYSNSDGMKLLRRCIGTTCSSLRSKLSVSLNSHMFLIYLIEKCSSELALPLEKVQTKLETAIKQQSKKYRKVLPFIPTTISRLIEICVELSDKGHILFLLNEISPEKSFIIVDKAALLAEINDTMFAPEDFKQHCQLATSTSVVPQSKLAEHFPDINIAMLVRFLSHLELAVPIKDQEVLHLINEHIGFSSEKYLFCPALIRIEVPPRAFVYQVGQLYHFAWILSTIKTDHFLNARFLHVLLRLTLSLGRAPKVDPEIPALQHQCSVWKTGVYWNTPQDAEVLVEVVDKKRVVVFIQSNIVTSELLSLRCTVVQKVRQAARELCPSVVTEEFLISPSDMTYPLTISPSTPLFSLKSVAQSIVQQDLVVVSVDGDARLKVSACEVYAHLGERIFQTLFNSAHDTIVSDEFFSALCSSWSKSPQVVDVISSVNSKEAVSTQNSEESLLVAFETWRNGIINQCANMEGKAPLIVVGSHANLVEESPETDRNKQIISEAVQKYVVFDLATVMSMDCYYANTDDMKLLRHFVGTISQHRLEVNLGSNIFFFEKHSYKLVLTVQTEIETAIQQQSKKHKELQPYILTPVIQFVDLCIQRNDKVHILFLLNETSPVKIFIITEKTVLQAEMNGMMFGSEDFKQQCQLALDTGVVPKSKLAKHIAAIHTTMLVRFLSHLELAISFEDQEVLRLINEHLASSSEKYPPLVRIKAPPKAFVCQGGQLYHFGWILLTVQADDFLDSKFLHFFPKLALSLKLASKIDLEVPALQHQCSVWKTGVYWKTPQVWEVFVVVEYSKKAVVLMQSDVVSSDILKLQYSVLQKVWQTASELCPSIVTELEEFLVFSSNIAFPFISSSSTPLFSLIPVAQRLVQLHLFASVGGAEHLNIYDYEAYTHLGERVLHFLKRILNSFSMFAGRNPLKVAGIKPRELCEDFLSAHEQSVNELTNSANWDRAPISDNTWRADGTFGVVTIKVNAVQNLNSHKHLNIVKQLSTRNHSTLYDSLTLVTEMTNWNWRFNLSDIGKKLHCSYFQARLLKDVASTLSCINSKAMTHCIQNAGNFFMAPCKVEHIAKVSNSLLNTAAMGYMPLEPYRVENKIYYDQGLDVFSFDVILVHIVFEVQDIRMPPTSGVCFKQKYTDGKPLMIATILLVTPLLDVALLLAFLLLYLCGDIESNPGPPTGGSNINDTPTKPDGPASNNDLSRYDSLKGSNPVPNQNNTPNEIEFQNDESIILVPCKSTSSGTVYYGQPISYTEKGFLDGQAITQFLVPPVNEFSTCENEDTKENILCLTKKCILDDNGDKLLDHKDFLAEAKKSFYQITQQLGHGLSLWDEIGHGREYEAVLHQTSIKCKCPSLLSEWRLSFPMQENESQLVIPEIAGNLTSKPNLEVKYRCIVVSGYLGIFKLVKSKPIRKECSVSPHYVYLENIEEKIESKPKVTFVTGGTTSLSEGIPSREQVLIKAPKQSQSFEKPTVREHTRPELTQHSDYKKLLKELEEKRSCIKTGPDAKFHVTKTLQALPDKISVTPSAVIQPPLFDITSCRIQQLSIKEASILLQLLSELNCPPQKVPSKKTNGSIQHEKETHPRFIVGIGSENRSPQLLKHKVMVFCSNSTSIKAVDSYSEEVAESRSEMCVLLNKQKRKMLQCYASDYEMKLDSDTETHPQVSTNQIEMVKMHHQYKESIPVSCTREWHAVDSKKEVETAVNILLIEPTENLRSPISAQLQPLYEECDLHTTTDVSLIEVSAKFNLVVTTQTLNSSSKSEQLFELLCRDLLNVVEINQIADLCSSENSNTLEWYQNQCKIGLQTIEFQETDVTINLVDVGGQPAFLDMIPSLTLEPAISCSSLHNETSGIVNCRPKVRKRVRHVPSSKQLYTFETDQRRKINSVMIQYTDNFNKGKSCTQNVSQRFSTPSKRARHRASLRRKHQTSHSSTPSETSNDQMFSSVENELALCHQLIDPNERAYDHVYNVRSSKTRVTHSFQLPTPLLTENHHGNHLKNGLTLSEMTQLLTFPMKFVFIQQVTESSKAEMLQLVKQSVVHSSDVCSMNHNGIENTPRVSLCRGKKARPVKKVTNSLCMPEISSDYSHSKMVNEVWFLRQIVHIYKDLRNSNSELTRLSSHRQPSGVSSGHSGGSQMSTPTQKPTSSQASNDHNHRLTDSTAVQTTASTKVRYSSSERPAEASSSKPLTSGHGSNRHLVQADGIFEESCPNGPRGVKTLNTKLLAKGGGNSRQAAIQVQSDGTEEGTCSNHRPAEASVIDSNILMKGARKDKRSANGVPADNGRDAHYQREYDQTSSRNYQQVSSNVEAAREIDFEIQHSASRKPDWISDVTKLLHVPDYSKMIQRLNSETPTTEHFVSHRFIRGIAYFKIGKFQQAMRDLSEGEKCAQETDQRGSVSLCSVYLGDLYYSSGSHLEAAKCYQKAAEYYEIHNIAKLFRMVAPTVSAIRAKCGSCFRTLSKSVEAIQEYQKAIEASTKDKDRLTAHTSLGNLYQSSGQNDKALKEYEQALELAQRLNDHVSVAWTHGNLGNAYLGLGMKDKALFHLQKALDLTVKYEPTPSAIGRAYNNIGTSYQSMGDLDKAEEHYDLALSQAIYGNDPAGQARVYGNIGNIFIVRKMFEKAIPHYSEVLRLSSDEATVTTALHNRGCAYYEWAESKMIALEKSSSLNRNLPAGCIVFRIHGSKAESHEHSPRIVINSVYKLYKQGKEDLEKVLASHERKLDHIKGSSKGLSLTVSLFESNSRTFHRLQDCMVNLGNWREALLVAEQSKARTLGEMMLSRKGSQLDHPLTSPLNLKQIYAIVSSQSSPVLYLSHTGASILGWVLVPMEDSSIFMEMFEVPLTDDQFDGKSFDYHTRYSLTEILVEQSYEMYCSVEYSEEYTAPAVTLYELIGRPLQAILNKVKKVNTLQKIVLITDTYTALLPFTCLYNPESKTFLGDSFYFEIGLSFLTMGIMSQLPEPIVELPADPQNMCIIGNPTIPQFYHNNEVWSLGKLPYAKREAQWVGHILGTPPILDEQATKSAILMRFMRAKLIHIATHGSSVSGFLAFSALTSTRQGEVVDSSSVLLHPEEVEKLSISPALVVLSSCDSARGTVKADGIQGMARAFLLAGAQAVMTALWRVPDESAAVFMRFFYRFLGEGLESSLALQKSILSLRCFAKYSQYIHWSGYQLTGRSIRFAVSSSPVTTILDSTLGKSSAFPRLMLVKKLQSVLVENPRLPTDIQFLHGSPGVKPSEVVIDFIHSSHQSFAAGIFWINCLTSDLIDASLLYIERVIKKPLNRLHLNETQQALFVLDNATKLPDSQQLLQLFKHSNVHIIILSKHSESLDPLVKKIDKVLIRGCKVQEVKTLSTIDSTQRIVYELFKKYQLSANNNDQRIFEKLAEFTSGSPVIVDIAINVLLKFVRECSESPSQGLNEFSKAIQLLRSGKSMLKLQATSNESPFQVRAISDELTRLAPDIASVPPTHRDAWESESEYDSWDSIAALLDHCINSPGELLLLRSLSIFGCCPIPLFLVTTMSSFIAQSSGHSHLGGILHERLLEAKLLKKYPLPVVLHSSYTQSDNPIETQFVYVPQHLANHLWTCEVVHQLVAITLAYKTLKKVTDLPEKNSVSMHFYLGLILLLEEKSTLFKGSKQCFEEVFGLYLSTYHQLHASIRSTSVKA